MRQWVLCCWGVLAVLCLALPGGLSAQTTGAISGRVVLDEVEVRAGRVTPLSIVLQPSENLTERIRVSARPQIINLDSSTTETRFSSEYVESLPILGRNYQDILTLAPGVTDVDGDGNPNIHGALSRHHRRRRAE